MSQINPRPLPATLLPGAVAVEYPPMDRKRLWPLLVELLAIYDDKLKGKFLKDAGVTEEEGLILAFLDRRRYSELATLEQYLRELVAMYNFIRLPYSQWTESDGNNYVTYLYKTRKLKETSIQTKMAAPRVFISWLHKKEYIRYDILDDVRLPKIEGSTVSNIIKRALDFDEVDQALEAIEDQFTLRDIAIFYILARMGLRASELCGLKWGALTRAFGGWHIEVLGKGKKRRTLAIPKAGVHYLMQYRLAVYGVPMNDATPVALLDLPIFAHHYDMGKAIGRKNLYCIVVKISKHAALRHFSPHDLRHTCLTHLSLMGTELNDLRKVGGHAKIDTTANYVDAGNALVGATTKFDSEEAMNRFRSSRTA